MKIFLASDHAGFELKEKIKRFLQKQGIAFVDVGTHSAKSTDYPDFIISAAEQVAHTRSSLGIVLGGSGQGEAIAANKVKGIRAAVYYGGSFKIVELSKEHNNANVLSLGARFLDDKTAIRAVSLWLKTKFSNAQRHKRRIRKIAMYEDGKWKPFEKV
ncbi:RpiB/LacA/LacB family sugar-phosphate isomerase [Candidatus Pacearchaeota archaeon]|nr:MAG: RpiB/LacA/LacB family sugar-phosphate isomerase [Candidatus Pacearchaeota archaeon]